MYTKLTYQIAPMASKNVEILGILYSTAGDKEVLGRIEEAIRSRTRLTIIQPHFFHAVLGRNDPKICDLYRKYDLALPDGYGMFLAVKILYGREEAFKNIFNGTDLYELLLKEANVNNWRIFFFGDTGETLQALNRKLGTALPGLIIAGTHHGFVDLDEKAVLAEINASGADILMIGMGTPQQDAWLWKYSQELQVPVILTVGAGIGFISGKKIRAPVAFRTLHLEWLFRLFQEPRRLWRRYILGIPKFIFYIFVQKVGQK